MFIFKCAHVIFGMFFLGVSVGENCEGWLRYGYFSHFTSTPFSPCPGANSTIVNLHQISSLPSASNPVFRSSFQFPRAPIMKMDCLNEDPVTWMKLKEPVLLKHCQFFERALKWNLEYLSKELTDEYAVSLSDSRKFLYYDSTVDYSNYEKSGWKPPYRIQYNSFEEFLEMASELSQADNGTHAYFQTLLLNEEQNTSVQSDLNNFDYSWLLHVAFELGWSTNVLNMLFVGMPDVVTPLHYDIMENVFIQLQGRKRFILFSPDQYTNLYPHPIGHPHDRQSQVDLDTPDYERFPKFRNVQSIEAILEPGDVLYVPTNWWHHVESNKNDFTVSLNFWFEDHLSERITSKIAASAASGTQSTLTPTENMAFRRHIETIVYNMTRSPEKVKEILEDILHGRFGS
ncbi:hypoxia-inducible factor 1-alpha inhibitor-like [Dendronephthya gigantea]|uniref:hypoxia-inducible factor 1-alpha inhibitor-like n=1 Tax=Dendronephthya gigantea TaxID=151771 RepID=UPI00106BDCE7|nr:hypoxia-inducible factor 1-alpha inhibitor-like [Dendronephthya gigantea]